MFVRALAQVYRCQVKAKNLHRAYQRLQALRHHGRTVVGLERSLDGAQLGGESLRPCVGILRRDRVACRFGTGELFQRGGQAGIHAGQCAAVGFVHAVHVLVGRAFGQGLHLGGARVEHGRDRQLATQVVHFG